MIDPLCSVPRKLEPEVEGVFFELMKLEQVAMEARGARTKDEVIACLNTAKYWHDKVQEKLNKSDSKFIATSSRVGRGGIQA